MSLTLQSTEYTSMEMTVLTRCSQWWTHFGIRLPFFHRFSAGNLSIGFFFSFLLSSLQKLTEFSYTLMAKFLNINQFECCRRDSCKEICLESQELLMISYFLSSWRSLYKKFLQNKKSPLSGRKSPGLEVSCNFECPVYRTSPLVNLQQCHGRFPS